PGTSTLSLHDALPIFNYLLDLAAAGSLGLAAATSRVGRTPLYPALAIASLAVAAVLLDPLGIVPGRTATTGAWADPARLATMRADRKSTRLNSSHRTI